MSDFPQAPTPAFLFDLDGTPDRQRLPARHRLEAGAGRDGDRHGSSRRATVVTKSPRDYATSGGYGQDELERTGAFRGYADPADMLDRLDELGVRFAD